MQLKLAIIILFISTLVYSENYKKVKIEISNSSEIIELQELGFPIDDAFQNRDGSIDIFINSSQFYKLKNSSLQFEVLIDDWSKYYKERSVTNSSNNLSKNNSKFNVQGFTYGTMGGFYKLDEIWEKIDEMISNYPNLISVKDSIGTSYEGRTIYALRISDNPNVNEDEPEVLYTALHHAREPESMMQMIYFMFYLLENYGSDAEVTYLVDNRELYFIPIVNPDGYFYNQTTNPSGGGMWRKNRRLNPDSNSIGVDLNRNYGFKWAYDNSGSSDDQTSSTYRGTEAFSEPETETIRQYCISHNFKLALNYHTYSNLLITPWGYIPEATPDSIFYSDIAKDMTQYNHYTWGYSSEIIYAVNGDSDDWFYGEQTEKNKIFAMTPEVGSGSDGFWPTQDRIIPLAEENIFPNLYLAWVAGGYISSQEIEYDKEFYTAGDNGGLTIHYKNKGLEDLTDLIIKVTSVSSNLEILVSEVGIVGSINAGAIGYVPNGIRFQLKDDAIAGDSASYVLKYFANNVLISTEKYSFTVGRPEIFYSDSLSTLENWNTKSNVGKNWEVTNNQFYSAPSSITESIGSNYLPNSEVTLTSNKIIDLVSLSNPYLKFKTKYSIESGWDYGQVAISTDSLNWKVIGGENSKLGSGNFQPSTELIYDGLQKEWITENININEFGGNEIYLKFQLKSDEYIQEDGWYIDDIEIFEYTNSVVSVKSENESLPTEFGLSQNYPNPFNPSTTINYSIPNFVESRQLTDNLSLQSVKLTVYDILGRKVATLVNKEQTPGNYKVNFDASKLSSGLYLYRLHVGEYANVKKMVLLK